MTQASPVLMWSWLKYYIWRDKRLYKAHCLPLQK